MSSLQDYFDYVTDLANYVVSVAIWANLAESASANSVSGLSDGAIAGIVFGVLAAVTVFTILAACFKKLVDRHRQRRSANVLPSHSAQPAATQRFRPRIERARRSLHEAVQRFETQREPLRPRIERARRALRESAQRFEERRTAWTASTATRPSSAPAVTAEEQLVPVHAADRDARRRYDRMSTLNPSVEAFLARATGTMTVQEQTAPTHGLERDARRRSVRRNATPAVQEFLARSTWSRWEDAARVAIREAQDDFSRAFMRQSEDTLWTAAAAELAKPAASFTRVREVTDDVGETTTGKGNCIVCMDATLNAIYLECGHLVTCMDCAAGVAYQDKVNGADPKCLVCRVPTAYRRVYFG